MKTKTTKPASPLLNSKERTRLEDSSHSPRLPRQNGNGNILKKISGRSSGFQFEGGSLCSDKLNRGHFGEGEHIS